MLFSKACKFRSKFRLAMFFWSIYRVDLHESYRFFQSIFPINYFLSLLLFAFTTTEEKNDVTGTQAAHKRTPQSFPFSIKFSVDKSNFYSSRKEAV